MLMCATGPDDTIREQQRFIQSDKFMAIRADVADCIIPSLTQSLEYIVIV